MEIIMSKTLANFFLIGEIYRMAFGSERRLVRSSTKKRGGLWGPPLFYPGEPAREQFREQKCLSIRAYARL